MGVVQHSYTAFGLEISSGQPLPGLTRSLRARPADLYVHFGKPATRFAEDYLFEKTFPVGSADPVLIVRRDREGSFHFQYRDNTTFVIDAHGSEVWADWPDDLTFEDMSTYLYGPIFAFLLRRRGLLCLHASSIRVGGSAIAVLGSGGAGKSTTAAAFAKSGFHVITDDVTALVEQSSTFLVQPGYPGLRLWPDSVSSLWGSPDALPAMTPNWEKRYLDLPKNGYQFATQPIPLSAIYVLGKRVDDPNAPLIEPDQQPAFVRLLANSYQNYLLDNGMRACEFDVLSRLVKAVPVRLVSPHADISRLPQLLELILRDIEVLQPLPAQ